MANTIRWFDREWNVKASAAIGALSLAGGIYFDGHHYWLTDQTGATGNVGRFQLENGTFYGLGGWTLPAGYSAPTGITSDGHNIFVACTKTDPGPPVSVTREVLMFDKAGNLIKVLGAVSAPTAVTIPDLDFDGQNLVVIEVGTGTGEQIRLVDLAADTFVYDSADFARTPYAVTFDGMNYPAAVVIAGTYYGVTFDSTPTLLTGTVALPAQPYGCTMVCHEVSEWGVPELFSAEAIAMAFRA